MKRSGEDPVSAFFSGIESSLVRILIAWVVSVVGLSTPLVFVYGVSDAGLSVFFWPMAFVYGIVLWGGLPWGLSVGAVLLPLLMVICAWGFVTDNSARFGLWGLWTASLLLTGPGLTGFNRVALIAGGWLLVSLIYFGIPWWWQRRNRDAEFPPVNAPEPDSDRQ